MDGSKARPSLLAPLALCRLEIRTPPPVVACLHVIQCIDGQGRLHRMMRDATASWPPTPPRPACGVSPLTTGGHLTLAALLHAPGTWRARQQAPQKLPTGLALHAST